MDRYFAFRRLLDFMADYSVVTNAHIKNYAGDIEITGEDDVQEIKISVSFLDKEVADNGD